jgi:hypothetical protein
MNFQPDLCDKVINDEKWVTRRLKKPGEQYVGFRPGGKSHCVITAKGTVKYRVGDNAAICPGRGKAHKGRKQIISIREEPSVADISQEEAVAEGFTNRDDFLARWDAINGKGHRNDPVWRIEFARNKS